MPTTQKSQQKQTKATQKVGGSAKKPVTKAMEGGKGKVAAVKTKATMRGGSAKGGSFYNYEETKERSIKNEKDINKIKGEVIPALVKMISYIYNVNCENLKKKYPNEEFIRRELKETVWNLEIDYGIKRDVYNENCEPEKYPYGLHM
jgi:hypothetical protein